MRETVAILAVRAKISYMATEQQRSLVWESRYHAEMLHRYYGYLSGKLARRDRWIALGALLLSSVTATSLLWFPDIAKFSAGFATVLNLWLVISRYSHKSLISSGLRTRCADWLTECKLLWSKADVLNSDEIEQQWKRLQDDGTKLTDLADSELGLDEKLREKSENEAYEICKAQSV